VAVNRPAHDEEAMYGSAAMANKSGIAVSIASSDRHSLGAARFMSRRLVYKGSHTENTNTDQIGILAMGNFEKPFFELLGHSTSSILRPYLPWAG